MIASIAPLRVSFIGGGSDIPEFYSQQDGCVVSMAIEQSVRVLLNERPFDDTLRLVYRHIEDVVSLDNLQHTIARAALKRLRIDPLKESLEIVSVGDVPAGTGLGSSGAYTVALVNALLVYQNRESIDRRSTAELAYAVEVGDAGRGGGKQDIYASVYGGINKFEFSKTGYVTRTPLILGSRLHQELESRLMLIYTGQARDTTTLLTTTARSVSYNEHLRGTVAEQASTALRLFDSLQLGHIDAVGDALNRSWGLKRQIEGVASAELDEMHRKILCAADHPHAGAKLCGAGGGGCFLVYAPLDRHPVIESALGLPTIPIRIAREGARHLTIK